MDCRVSFFERDFGRCVALAHTAEEQLPATLFGALPTAMLDEGKAARCARERLYAQFLNYDLEGYARTPPIAAPSSLALDREAAECLSRA